MNVFERWRASAPWLLSLSRIIVGFLFTQIGTGKLWAFPAAIMPGGHQLRSVAVAEGPRRRHAVADGLCAWLLFWRAAKRHLLRPLREQPPNT